MFDNMENYIMVGALLVVACIAIICGRRVYLMTDMVVLAGFGTWLILFPKTHLKFQVDGELNDVHIHLERLLGAVFIGNSLFWWFSKDTRDGTVPITILTSRVFTTSIMLMASVYTQFWSSSSGKAVRWNENHIYFGLGGSLCWLLSSLYHLVFSEDYSTYPQFNIRLNTHLRIDACLIVLYALLAFGFPNVAISVLAPGVKSDPVNTHIVRFIGIQFMGSGLISLLAPGFLREEDKKSQLLCRLLMYIPLMLVVAFEQLMYNRYSRQSIIWGSLCDMSLIINAFISQVTDCTTIYKVKAK